eukprot:620526_1
MTMRALRNLNRHHPLGGARSSHIYGSGCVYCNRHSLNLNQQRNYNFWQRLIFKTIFGNEVEHNKKSEIETLEQALKRIEHLELKLKEKEMDQKEEEEDNEENVQVIAISKHTVMIIVGSICVLTLYGFGSLVSDISNGLQHVSDRVTRNI